MPAAATFSATSRCRCSDCSDSETQWLAVTPCGKPVATTRSARSSSASIAGFSVSSVCRSIGSPASAAIVSKLSLARCGIRLEVRAAADRRRCPGRSPRAAALADLAPASPIDGHAHSATTWISTRSRSRSRTSISASTEVSRAGQREVDVGADRGAAVGRQQPRGALGALDRVVERDRVASAFHRQDRAHQIAGRVRRRARRGTPCRDGRAARRTPAAGGSRRRPEPRGGRAAGSHEGRTGDRAALDRLAEAGEHFFGDEVHLLDHLLAAETRDSRRRSRCA